MVLVPLFSEWRLSHCSASGACPTVQRVALVPLFSEWHLSHCSASGACPTVQRVALVPLFSEWRLSHCSVSGACPTEWVGGLEGGGRMGRGVGREGRRRGGEIV